MVARKIYVCHFNKKNKIANSKRSTSCQAKIDIKIKKLNKDTKRNDPFLKSHDPPLQAVIVMHTRHNHYQHSFDAMSFLRATKETREIFRQYFEDGHGTAASIRLHELKLEMEEDGFVKIGNSAINPKMTTVQHWYRLWKDLHYGDDTDPLAKLEEKKIHYSKLGRIFFYLNNFFKGQNSINKCFCV